MLVVRKDQPTLWESILPQELLELPEELEVLGYGEQEKSYILVDECIDGMLHGILHPQAQCDIYNLGANTTLKVKEIARIIPEELGLKDVRLKYTGGG